MTLAFKSRFHYLFRASWLAALSFYIMHLNEKGSLHYYLVPHLQKLLLLCPVPLLFIAFGMAWHAITGGAEQVCDCEHSLPAGFLRNTGIYGLLVIPLIFAFLMPDLALGSDMAAKKGMNYAFSEADIHRKPPDKTASLQSPNLNELFVAKDSYNAEFAELAKRLYLLPTIEVDSSIFSETIGAIQMYKQPFLNKKITLQGFVFREKGMQADLFSVSRFLMMCCPADATPFGVMVQANNASSFPNDAWVEIQGTVQETTMNGKETLQIKASRIQKINPPASPYIYTNPDSVAEFEELHPDNAAKVGNKQ
ncbi:TIGR03943 family putative permease subunit [Paenibacillus dokdonensis]|uniref:TIGR03943 family putative permease subunit n=1 Tax=Paenibacillus dokdonensis TaxID=2567944 RepID=UPI0010A8401C|nr:TIGR03943 family protein [Paenibacillus dokdonensis]